MKDLILRTIARNVTMNDTTMAQLFLTFDNPLEAYTMFASLLEDGTIITAGIHENGEMQGRKIGNAYSLPSPLLRQYR